MILFSWLLTLLVAQLALGFDYSIDLKRCGLGPEQTGTLKSACAISGECLNPPSTDFLLETFSDHKRKMTDCKYALQITTLAPWKYHVMMQVKITGPEKLKFDIGLTLHHGENLFVCKPDGISGSFDFKFAPLGRQIFEDQHLFCSFVAEIADKRKKELIDIIDEKLDTRILYATNFEERFLFFPKDKLKLSVWRSVEPPHCNTDHLTSSTKDSTTNTSIVLMEVDTVSYPLRCAASSFVVRKKVDNHELNVQKVVCEKVREDNKRKYVWQYEDAGQMKQIDGEFEIFCPIKRCRLCKSAPPPLSCPGCAVTTYTSTGAHGNDCPTLTCATGKLTATGKSALDGDAECKRSGADPAKYAWFVGETELKEAACLDNSKPAVKRDAAAASAFEEYLTRAL